MGHASSLVFILMLKCIFGYYDNETSPSMRQLLDFKLRHPVPIGLHTVGSGAPVEIRDMITINSDLFRDEFFFDSQAHMDGERIPERVVHTKGFAAWGYFVVTNDVSKYTKADVFNGIGKKTPVLVRASIGTTARGASDVTRDLKGLTTKFYTKEGNLDFLNLNTPMFLFKEPLLFPGFVHVSGWNPRTHLRDLTPVWELITLTPDSLAGVLYLLSEYGIPDGYRYTDYFPAHTYELVNKHGERWYARFNFRSEQGLRNLTVQQAQQIQGTDLHYYTRDLYNAIENKDFPSWRVEIDVLSLQDIQKVDYNPFDLVRLWKKGTYKTVTIGRLIVNRNSDNQFRDMEQSAFNPSNLVPGIPGPIDTLFRARRYAYRDAQNYRVGRNHLNIGVNAPLYQKSYVRDGRPPVGDNGRDAPNYFPNSFNGPLPLVDDSRPKEQLIVLERNAVDLQEAADMYNKFLPSDSSRQRVVEGLVTTLLNVLEPVRNRALKLLSLTDRNLGRRVTAGIRLAQLRAGNNG